MEEIIKTLLLEGIDEDTIHRVLDVIEEEYVLINELNDKTLRSAFQKAEQIAAEQEVAEPEAKDKEFVQKEIKKRKRQGNKIRNYYENQVVTREEKKYRERKKKNKPGEN